MESAGRLVRRSICQKRFCGGRGSKLPSPAFAEIFQISGRENCNEAIFAQPVKKVLTSCWTKERVPITLLLFPVFALERGFSAAESRSVLTVHVAGMIGKLERDSVFSSSPKVFRQSERFSLWKMRFSIAKIVPHPPLGTIESSRGFRPS